MVRQSKESIVKYKKWDRADHNALIAKSVNLLNKGKLINEKDLGVDRQKIKTIMVSVKKKHGLDVLTINRGHRTIGWILSDEVL